MMTSPVGGHRPASRHQSPWASLRPAVSSSLTPAFPTSAAGYFEAIELLTAHGVEQVGIEGSAGWGVHAAIRSSWRPASMLVRCRLNDQRRNVVRVAWTRPTLSMLSLRRGHCSPSQRSAGPNLGGV